MILVNGIESDCVPVDDRGFQYGDGLFETMLWRDGRIALWPRHWQRLSRDCRRLGIGPPSRDALEQAIDRVGAGHDRAVIKTMVTRGESSRGYAVTPATRTSTVVRSTTLPDIPRTRWSQGIRVRLCQTRLGRNPALAGIKHLNRLEQVLARREWSDDSIAEGVMCDSDDNVVECVSSNIFLFIDDCLVTPLLNFAGVAGIMRSCVLDIAGESGIAVTERAVAVTELEQADEIFVCNSIIGIWPVNRMETRQMGEAPVTRRIMAELAGQGLGATP